MSRGQESDLLREYVHKALTNKAKGADAISYANLVKELATLRRKADKDPSELTTMHLLANMVHAFKDCVSALRERKHDLLLNEVLGIKLWTAHPTVRDAVLEFIGTLVVANAAFTHTCLQLLVYSFLPPPAPPKPDADQGPWTMPEDASLVQSAVLATLTKVLQMVPTAPTKLLQLVGQHMPHKLRDRSTQCMYMAAMLSLAEVRAGAPIRDGLLATAVEHLLSIDVEIRWEDIVEVRTGQEAEEGATDDEDQEDIFELEGMSELDINATPEEIAQRHKEQQAQAKADRGGWEGAQAQAVASTSGRPAVDETANKLDSLMELMFEHLAKRQQAGQIAELWSSLLSIFERIILHTHRSKFTQFLIFFVCSRQPQPCAAAFVDLLLSRIQDSRQPSITRSACAAYAASFLARAAFIPPAFILSSLQRLVLICQQLCAAASTGAGAPGMHRSVSNPTLTAGDSDAAAGTSQDQVFHATVQSILYILCYQLRTLMGGAAGQECSAATRQLIQSQLLPLLTHKLGPLTVCLPSVVAEFKHQAAVLGLLDAAALAGTGDEDSRPQRPLEMFFPFDPYLLKRSSRHLKLKDSYVRWQRGQPSAHGPAALAAEGAAAEGASDGDSDVSDSDAEDDDEHDDANGGMDDASLDEDSSEDELEGMSVPSDSVLARPGLPSARGMAAAGKMLPPPSTMLGLHHGGFRAKRRSTAEDMAMSYSPGHLGSIGDATPAGMSPGLVNYISPAGTSPMQMTPVMHVGMEAAAARLGRF